MPLVSKVLSPLSTLGKKKKRRREEEGKERKRGGQKLTVVAFGRRPVIIACTDLSMHYCSQGKGDRRHLQGRTRKSALGQSWTAASPLFRDFSIFFAKHNFDTTFRRISGSTSKSLGWDTRSAKLPGDHASSASRNKLAVEELSTLKSGAPTLTVHGKVSDTVWKCTYSSFLWLSTTAHRGFSPEGKVEGWDPSLGVFFLPFGFTCS